ncbi:DNA-processing protein DprA [Rhizobium sp. L1K21]|uniref:DNA-processing protein DprA n=1 Tax=Rhizobium sp. L1K21 TaxID=2954933 RepID=UPI002092B1F5|nr:DNA-processing protein DprA [Rhizobium sp. L1K21]MCO6186026.1 DNA-processing protein DprA [Rhizobium sp. L1K21]
MNEGGAKPKGIHLSERQRIAWLRLIRSDNVGPVTFKDLVNSFGSAENALGMLPELSQRGGSTRSIRVTTEAEAIAEMERAHRFGARFVGIGEPEYPWALRQIDGAPPLLAVKGETNVTVRPALGIVGSRNASISGAKFASLIAAECGRAGYAIVSGLARGIDTAAHRASLSTGTIACFAGGLDMPYPPENLRLYEDICANGGLAVSEMPFGWEPRARDFPRRNRLIAGVALGVAVVEAAVRSGSLITARRAADFGRIVFAVPGSPLDPRSKGTNELIRNGATLIAEPSHVLEALAPISQIDLFSQPKVTEPEWEKESSQIVPPGESERERIVSALGPTPVEIDDIIRHTELSAASVYMVLLELDLAGRLSRHPGGLVSLDIG